MKTVKHTQCQIEMINKAPRQGIPGCAVRCDRQVRAKASKSISVPLSPKGWDRQQQRENHFTMRRGNGQERNLRRRGQGEKESCGERNCLGGEVIGVVGRSGGL